MSHGTAPRLRFASAIALASLSFAACDGCGDAEVARDPGDTSTASVGSGGAGGAPGTTAATFVGPGSGGSTSTGEGGLGPCGPGDACPEGRLCKYDLCIPDLGPCDTNDDCPGDSYCDADGICVPYGVPPGTVNDDECVKIPDLDVTPVTQCEWASPAEGDPTFDYVNVYSAPMVADFGLDGDPNQLRPSIVATTWTTVEGERIGMLRVFDGRTCEEQMRIGGPDDPDVGANRPAYASQWAIGDLDGDVTTGQGHPEIVGLHRIDAPFGTPPAAALIAYRVDDSADPPLLERLWYGRDCGSNGPDGTMLTFGSAMAEMGPGLWDLDDDGVPEVVLDRAVFDADGCLLNPPLEYEAYLAQGTTSKGVFSAIADVDRDGEPELVRWDRIDDWDAGAQEWLPSPDFVPSAEQRAGQIAIVDLGHYSDLPGQPATDPLPEIVVVSAATSDFNPSSTGSIRVQTLKGDVVFGPIDFPIQDQAFGGHGGPPTASDFDGDGWPEIAAAAGEFYAVYDPDCVDGGDPARPGGVCDRPIGTPLPDFILWQQPSRDFSSSITGSSIFDFDGDGRAEAVYHDECYLRVYDGGTGEVLFSAPRASGTGTELPIIVDVDGDFAAEIVAARALNAPACTSPDPLYPESGEYVQRGGIVVYRDPEDQWASSRPIWNQHAYSVTHVEDDGTIPRTSDVARNWETEGLNSFRQNVQGSNALALADLTVELESLDEVCAGEGGTIDLTARVCNRGTAPVQDGAVVAFYTTPQGETLDDGNGQLACQTQTNTLLDVGDCTTVSCQADLPPNVDVWVVVDPEGVIADCHGNNNVGAGSLALCPQGPN